MNTIQNHSFTNFNGNAYHFNSRNNNEKILNSISFTATPNPQYFNKNKKSLFNTICSVLGIKSNSKNQLVKNIDEVLKDRAFVHREHSSFSSAVNDFIYGNYFHIKQGLVNGKPVYKGDGYYVIQHNNQEGIAVFEKLNSKGKLIDKIYIPESTL